MQRMEFEEAIEVIVSKDKRYDADAYDFLRGALDFTLKRHRGEAARVGEEDDEEGGERENRHVSGKELLGGFRDHALEEFGPMAITVLEEWGIRSSDDVGEMVFNLIDVGVFGRAETDTREDFRGVLEFEKAFQEPFAQNNGARALDGSGEE
ncbi:MAG: Minf_1886 family protein [Verrucomicrobiota bacterium]